MSTKNFPINKKKLALGCCLTAFVFATDAMAFEIGSSRSGLPNGTGLPNSAGVSHLLSVNEQLQSPSDFAKKSKKKKKKTSKKKKKSSKKASSKQSSKPSLVIYAGELTVDSSFSSCGAPITPGCLPCAAEGANWTVNYTIQKTAPDKAGNRTVSLSKLAGSTPLVGTQLKGAPSYTVYYPSPGGSAYYYLNGITVVENADGTVSISESSSSGKMGLGGCQTSSSGILYQVGP